VFKRDYPLLQPHFASDLVYADILLDEQTGIVLEPFHALQGNNECVDTIATRLAALSQQLARCWLLFYMPQRRGSQKYW
jgi:hypothetical protein